MTEEEIKKAAEREYPVIPKEEVGNSFQEMSNMMQMCRREGFERGIKWLLDNIWHKRDDLPGNKHPFPAINPDTQEMAFAFHERLCGWQFDRDYISGANMLWLDIEKILPTDVKENGV